MLQNTYRNQGLDTLFGPGKISEFWASNIHARGLQTYTLEGFKHTYTLEGFKHTYIHARGVQLTQAPKL